MKTAKEKIDLKNHVIFNYDNKDYTYDGIYQLIKQLQYKTVGAHLDYVVKPVFENGKPAICIFFQQSTTVEDWIHNFEFWAVSTKAYKGWEKRLKFCKGFFEEYNSGRDNVIADVKYFVDQGVERIFIAGWSNGATVAQICCEDIYYQFGIKPTLISCEPAHPCANKHTRDYVRQCMRDDSIIWVYGWDVVPRCPPFPFGWKIKNLIYYIKMPDKFPILIRRLIAFIKDTNYYHCNLDEGIRKYVPNEMEN